MNENLVLDPDLDYDMAKPYWEGFQEEELRLPTCTECGSHHWYPQPACPSCGTESIEWKAVSGTTKLFSWVGVDYDFNLPYLKNNIPRKTALVTPIEDESIRLPAILAAGSKPEIDSELEITFSKTTEGLKYPIYQHKCTSDAV